MTTNSFIYDDLNINHIVKKSLKHSYISITPELEIFVKTPQVTQIYLFDLLESRKAWIQKKLSQMQENQPVPMKLEDEVLLFGEVYSIDTIQAENLREKLQKLKSYTKKKVLTCYNSFYKEQANEYITPRVQKFSKLMNLDYKEIKYRKMKSRWGSCNSNKVLTFNTELIKIKKELIDYVVVHELAHLKHMNHSKSFHEFVESHLLDSKEKRQELKKIKIATF